MKSLVIKEFKESNMRSYIVIVCLFMVSLPFNVFAQAQKNSDQQLKLSFTVSSEMREDKTETNEDIFNLIITADRKSINNAERLYIRVIDPETERNIYVKAINKEVLKGAKANSDESFKKIQADRDKVLLNFGPFEKGTYYVYIKIKDDADNVYFSRQKITL